MNHHTLHGSGLALCPFIAEHNIQVFSEAVAWTVARIAQVQDALGMRIGI